MRMLKHRLKSCLIVLLVLFTFGIALPSEENNLAEYLQSICVKVNVEKGGGSGIAFTRKDWTGTNDVTFVWTAGHLFHHELDLFDIIFFSQKGTNEPVVAHCTVEQEIVKDGRVVGTTNKPAHMVKFSGPDTGEDLALLQVDSTYFNTNTVSFDLSGKIPRLGTHLFCIGCPLGLANSFSDGLISGIGRIIDQDLYDQTTCVVFPGSSGGGVFTSNGKYIGMTTAMKSANVNLIIPIRRMQAWVKREHIEWALDPNIPMPCEPDFKALPLTDKVALKTNIPPSVIIELIPKKSPHLKSPKDTKIIKKP